ncbi:MAG: hypothetical protein RMM98_18100 [Acidobacteriota bacterium]|nr:hypothetical protein [Blastocatellia bacterium]MDW8241518.1 hypothetical protein [Acidobacteriota bacterium]
MMNPQDHISRANLLCQKLRNTSAQVGSRDRPRTVRGADPNELKKLYTFLLKHRDSPDAMSKLRKLVSKLPDSNFAKRSGSTAGYYKNIKSALDGVGFYQLAVDDAIYILGWACRLL